MKTDRAKWTNGEWEAYELGKKEARQQTAKDFELWIDKHEGYFCGNCLEELKKYLFIDFGLCGVKK